MPLSNELTWSRSAESADADGRGRRPRVSCHCWRTAAAPRWLRVTALLLGGSPKEADFRAMAGISSLDLEARHACLKAAQGRLGSGE